MPSAAFKKEIKHDLPVLFVNIGWTVYYDGTEDVVGKHSYLQNNPGKKVRESSAFIRSSKGSFRCGIGNGESEEGKIHVVFVARDRGDEVLKVVGVYAAANHNDWRAWTKNAERIAVGFRPMVKAWRGQGMRRWAKRKDASGKEHKYLLRVFDELTKGLLSSAGLPAAGITAAEDDESAFEGEPRKRFIWHRKRERKFRAKKLREVMRENDNHLVCEVPGCGFDFRAQYGELGVGFAEVHHKIPLSQAPRQGRRVFLSDLAVVCANCHRMIHHGGQCRPLKGLIRAS